MLVYTDNKRICIIAMGNGPEDIYNRLLAYGDRSITLLRAVL